MDEAGACSKALIRPQCLAALEGTHATDEQMVCTAIQNFNLTNLPNC